VPEGVGVLGNCHEELSDEGRVEAVGNRGLHPIAGMHDLLSS
jgi:hypothetical protein